MSHLPPGPGYSGHQLHHQQQPQQQSYTSSSAAPRSGPSSSTIHDRASATASTSAGVVANAAIHGRRVTSNSSIASSGTAYSASTSARGSVQHGASGMGSARAAHMETTVTKLLVATKQLLEGLTDWSQGRISEEQVSDIYVRLGNSFNAAVAAFTKEGISMRWVGSPLLLGAPKLERAMHCTLQLADMDKSAETSKKCLSCYVCVWKLPSTKRPQRPLSMNTCPRSDRSSSTSSEGCERSKINIRPCSLPLLQRGRGLLLLPCSRYTRVTSTRNRRRGKEACPRVRVVPVAIEALTSQDRQPLSSHR